MVRSIQQTSISAATDPLVPYQGRPLISAGDDRSAYAGRVIIELWGRPNSSDAGGLAYQIDAVDGNNAALIQRIAAALPIRLSGG